MAVVITTLSIEQIAHEIIVMMFAVFMVMPLMFFSYIAI